MKKINYFKLDWPKTGLFLLLLCCISNTALFAQIPSGYYDAAQGKTGTQLKSALHGIIDGHTEINYDAVWDALKITDRDPNNSSNVIGIYSGFSMNAAAEYASGSGWNREHVWAKSRGDFGTSKGAGTDIHHLRAEDVSTNSARNNRNFGYGESYYIDGSGNYSGPTLSKTSSSWTWEPRDEVKGDVARMLFYMATRYEGTNGEVDLELTDAQQSSTDKAPFHATLTVLLEWHQLDPVSSEEIARNNAIYGIQSNRNPFIDHPEYVCEIWTCTSSNAAPQFTSSAVTSAIEGQSYSYSITSSDANGDAVTISAPTKPSWLSLTDYGNGTATLSGTPASGDIGGHSIVLTVSDGTASSNQNFSVYVISNGGGGTGSATDLFFSEYIEGSSYNKGIEIANFTGSSVNLANFSLYKQTNGAGSWTTELPLSGTLADGQVYVIVHTSADAAMKAEADLITGVSFMSFNGNDPVALFKSGALIDVIGTFNSTAVYAQDVTLVRKSLINSPNNNYTISEWDNHPNNTFSYLGAHTFDGGPGPEPDTEAPSTPTGLTPANVTETSVDLSWTASTDNVAVTAYDVYQDGGLIATVSANSYPVSDLDESTSYSFFVRATDAAGNDSGSSTSINVTTLTPADTQAPSVPGGLSSSNITTSSFNVSWTASTDNVGVASYEILLNGSIHGTTSNTSYPVSGLMASTTYSISVRANDAAGNTSASTSINVTTNDVPSGGCSGGISSFPYYEGFESGLGGWTQATTDDFDWTIDANGTPSNNTGPSSAAEGNYYLYTESSSPNYPSRTAILNSPCIDLTNEMEATFNFAFSMYGPNMGTLNLQASTNGSSWTSLWSLSGNQGNNWYASSVDLTSYVGGTVVLRFVGTTGNNYKSDMAIDNLTIITSAPSQCNDVTLNLTFDNYPEETSWVITNDGGSTVASGSYSNANPDGSTIIETACLEDGCYTFTIYDQYGDGICCAYGNGSYSLTKGSTLLASGGSFAASSSTVFCMGTGQGARLISTIGESNITNGQSLLYPNPVVDFLYISMPRGYQVIRIYSTNGAEMNNIQLHRNGIDVSSLSTGIYTIMIETEKGIIVDKFIKN